MAFKAMGLCDPVVKGVVAAGYTVPTEIQLKAIPVAVDGRDIIGCAQTGTGKTAAFVLPILHRLWETREGGSGRHIRSLIIAPTRELAVQIDEAIRKYGKFMNIRTVTTYGGVRITNQLRLLKKGVDIVVATPGRLLDHIERKTMDLRNVEVFVLDEADRMFDMGFINDVRRIVKMLPSNRQTLMFSATMSDEVRGLAKGIQKSPEMIQVGTIHNPIETITQHVYLMVKEEKMKFLLHMLKNQPMYSVLVFSRTKHGADQISSKLRKANIMSESLHSGRSQSQRESALADFKKGRFQVMVATDIAARGIDVVGISHVVNFDVPAFAEDYVHRIGRTGRAEATGDAITLVSPDEFKHLRQIEKFTGLKFTPKKFEGFDYSHDVVIPSHASEKRASGVKRVRMARSRRPKLARR